MKSSVQKFPTSKVGHYCVSVLVQQDVVAVEHVSTPTQTAASWTSSFRLSDSPTRRVTHLLRSLWMMGWVRLCRYSMPLATSMAMMSLDCRSMSLSIDTSLKRQPLSSRINGPCQSCSTLHRSMGAAHKRRHLVAQLARHFIRINDDPGARRDWLEEASKVDNETWSCQLLRKLCPCWTLETL